MSMGGIGLGLSRQRESHDRGDQRHAGTICRKIDLFMMVPVVADCRRIFCDKISGLGKPTC